MFASDIDSFKTRILQNAQLFGLTADGFEISMNFYVKVHFQKNFISENKVHCVFNRARTQTITKDFVPVKKYIYIATTLQRCVSHRLVTMKYFFFSPDNFLSVL